MPRVHIRRHPIRRRRHLAKHIIRKCRVARAVARHRANKLALLVIGVARPRPGRLCRRQRQAIRRQRIGDLRTVGITLRRALPRRGIVGPPRHIPYSTIFRRGQGNPPPRRVIAVPDRPCCAALLDDIPNRIIARLRLVAERINGRHPPPVGIIRVRLRHEVRPIGVSELRNQIPHPVVGIRLVWDSVLCHFRRGWNPRPTNAPSERIMRALLKLVRRHRFHYDAIPPRLRPHARDRVADDRHALAFRRTRALDRLLDNTIRVDLDPPTDDATLASGQLLAALGRRIDRFAVGPLAARHLPPVPLHIHLIGLVHPARDAVLGAPDLLAAIVVNRRRDSRHRIGRQGRRIRPLGRAVVGRLRRPVRRHRADGPPEEIGHRHPVRHRAVVGRLRHLVAHRASVGIIVLPLGLARPLVAPRLLRHASTVAPLGRQRLQIRRR